MLQNYHAGNRGEGMENDIGFLVKVIKDNIERYFNQELKPEGLTASQVQVLKFLRDQGPGKRITQKDIEKYLHVSHPTVVGILKRLENKGFIRTEFDGGDKRYKYVYTTGKEAEFHERMERSHEEVEQRLTNGMTEEQLKELRKLLGMVYENVKQ